MTSIYDMISDASLMPQEAMLWNKTNAKKLEIGLPKEKNPNEKRVILSPKSVQLIINNGHEICIQKGMGIPAGFLDNEYVLAGATIVESDKEIFSKAMVMRLSPPDLDEIKYLKPETSLISCMSKYLIDSEIIQALNKKRISAVGLDWVEDNAGGFPFTKIMGEIVGQLLLPIATEIMSSNPTNPILLGNVTGVPQKKLVILGAGNVTQILIKHAFPLGLNIEVFDKDIYKLQRLKQELNLPLSTQVIDSENLPLAMQAADLIIGALRSEGGITPCIVTEEMVARLNPGTLIMDICIDQGGCFETSEITNLSNPTFEKYGIIHYCVPNIASKVAQTASLAISNLLTSFILKTGKTGGIEEMIWQGKSFMKGIYCFGGYVTNKNVAKILGTQAKDIQLLLMRKG